MKRCSNCNCEMPDDMEFCGECGTALTPQTVICKACGAEMPGDMVFCGECGANMRDVSPPQQAYTPPQQYSYPQQPYRQPQGAAPKKKKTSPVKIALISVGSVAALFIFVIIVSVIASLAGNPSSPSSPTSSQITQHETQNTQSTVSDTNTGSNVNTEPSISGDICGSVTIQINPMITLGIDEDYIVRETRANEDGQFLLDSLNVINMKMADATNELIRSAGMNGFLAANAEVSIFVSSEDVDWATGALSDFRQNLDSDYINSQSLQVHTYLDEDAFGGGNIATTPNTDTTTPDTTTPTQAPTPPVEVISFRAPPADKYADCIECNGTGKVDCSFCNGTGNGCSVITECGGTGKVRCMFYENETSLGGMNRPGRCDNGKRFSTEYVEYMRALDAMAYETGKTVFLIDSSMSVLPDYTGFIGNLSATALNDGDVSFLSNSGRYVGIGICQECNGAVPDCNWCQSCRLGLDYYYTNDINDVRAYVPYAEINEIFSRLNAGTFSSSDWSTIRGNNSTGSGCLICSSIAGRGMCNGCTGTGSRYVQGMRTADCRVCGGSGRCQGCNGTGVR